MAEDSVFKLSLDNEAYILSNWDKKDLITLVREITGDQKADGRHIAGRAIREFIASKGFEIKTTKFVKKGELELTEDQKTYCKTNAHKMKPLEIVRILFDNKELGPLSREFKAIYAFLKTIENNIIKVTDEPVDNDYDVPKSVYRLVPRVNRAVPNPKMEGKPLFPDINNIPPNDEKTLRVLLSYMGIPQFGNIANGYTKKIDQELFESNFIGMTYDKPDLTREEVQQYMSLCAEIVTESQIARTIQKMEEQVEAEFEESKKVSMTLVEFIKKMHDSLKESKKNQQTLLKTLTVSRSDRVKKRHEAAESILNLLDAWRTEERRSKLIEIAMLQKEAESKDIDALASMDDVMALIAGLSKDEALN
jgi:uncharacterized protein (UPF0147 family)